MEYLIAMEDERRLTIEGVTAPVQVRVRNVFVIDKSGSMASVADSTIVGFNEQIGSMKENEERNPLQRHLCTLVQFNGHVDVIYEDQPAASATPLDRSTYVARGGTALFDAIGQTLTKLLADIPEGAPDRVIVTIMTDGDERDSTEFSESEARELIAACRARGWVVTFIGSAESAMKSASNLGIAAGNTAVYTASPAGTQEVFRSMNAARTRYADGMTRVMLQAQQMPGGMLSAFSNNAPNDAATGAYMSARLGQALNLRGNSTTADNAADAAGFLALLTDAKRNAATDILDSASNP